MPVNDPESILSYQVKCLLNASFTPVRAAASVVSKRLRMHFLLMCLCNIRRNV